MDMKLCIDTFSGFVGYEDLLPKAAAAGFDGFFSNMGTGRSLERMQKCRELADRYGLYYETSHSYIPGCEELWKADDPTGEGYVDVLKTCIDNCRAVSVPILVIHPSFPENGGYSIDAGLSRLRRVVEYALTEIPPEKILLGIPNYGYDWTLPFVQGESRATSISNQYAVTLAADNGVDISYDSQAQAPFFRYRDDMGREHEVWFEDARSIRAKLSLISRYNLRGAGYWNLMRPFPQNWLVLNSMFFLADDMSPLSPL